MTDDPRTFLLGGNLLGHLANVHFLPNTLTSILFRYAHGRTKELLAQQGSKRRSILDLCQLSSVETFNEETGVTSLLPPSTCPRGHILTPLLVLALRLGVTPKGRLPASRI